MFYRHDQIQSKGFYPMKEIQILDLLKDSLFYTSQLTDLAQLQFQ